MKALNQLYLAHPAFWEGDYRPDGFQWLDCHQEGLCVYAIQRSGGGENIAAVFNFSGQGREYMLKIPGAGRLELLLGSEPGAQDQIQADQGEFALRLPAFSSSYRPESEAALSVLNRPPRPPEARKQRWPEISSQLWGPCRL